MQVVEAPAAIPAPKHIHSCACCVACCCRLAPGARSCACASGGVPGLCAEAESLEMCKGLKTCRRHVSKQCEVLGRMQLHAV
jgi:hypothetical protein